MDLHHDFFERIKFWVKSHNTTIDAFMSEVSGGKWTEHVYFGWRKSAGLPSGEHIYLLAQYMNVSCDWLISGNDRNPLFLKYADFIKDMEDMDLSTLENARIMISSLAENCRKKENSVRVG